MVQSVQQQRSPHPHLSAWPAGPINLNQVSDFGALLRQLVGGLADSGGKTPAGAAGAPATQGGEPLPWVSPAQSLRYLAVRARPLVLPIVPALARPAPAQAGSKAQPASPIVPGVVKPALVEPGTAPREANQPMALESYPRPPDDNGRGVHWIPTTRQAPEVVDRFVEQARALGARWVTFLNEPGDLSGNEYLVRRLTAAGIMPVMRIYTDGGAPIGQDLTPLVRRYRALGVSYFQLYNEPNLRCENQGQDPDVNRYLARLIPAARQVIQAGGLPGIGALSPQGDVDDLTFLRQMLEGLKASAPDVLARAWISVHNYGADHLRVRQYDQVVHSVLGRSLPLIGTEGGIYPGGEVTEADQIRIVADAYRYLPRREPYYFAYSLWVLANKAGGGQDERWEYQALYRQEGPTALARALEGELRVGGNNLT